MAPIQLNLGGTSAQKRMPAKQMINFALIGQKRTNWRLTGPALALVALVLIAFVKFMVYDRLAAVAHVETEATAVQLELDACNARIATFGELNRLYAHYTYSGMTEEELALVDRIEVMELLEDVVLPRMKVNEWSVTGNRLTLSVEGKTLQEINYTAQELLAHELVSYCEVNTATTDPSTQSGLLNDDRDTVTANIVVHLEKRAEVTTP